MNTRWIGSPSDVRDGQAAESAIQQTNDAVFADPHGGVLKVSEERWLQAQEFEWRGWSHEWSGLGDDRSEEHWRNFDRYQAVPMDLGNVVEIGCGPFTQLRVIGEGRKIKSIALLDPLIHKYLSLQNCAYRDGKLLGVPISTISLAIEDVTWIGDLFDTVISINVLEHVRDAQRALEMMVAGCKVGGTIIFHDKAWDGFDPKALYDVGHPIRVTQAVLDAFYAQFTPLFRHGNYFIGRKDKDNVQA